MLIAIAISMSATTDKVEAKKVKPCKIECINQDQYLICIDSVFRHDSLFWVFEDTTLVCEACCY
jgi:hypothetical protein